MKFIINLLLVSLLSCSSVKEMKQDTSMIKIQEVYSQKWVAGIQGGGSGIDVYLNLGDSLEEGVSFNRIQIKDIETTVIQKTDDLKYIARFKTDLNQLNLDENTEKEYGNQAPQKKEFKLKEGQVKIYFTKNGQEFYKLIENVQEKPMMAYPSMKPQNNEE